MTKPKTVAEYLASLPEDRRKALGAVRRTIKKNLSKGYKEGIQYGVIGYFVPHSVFPAGYHCDPNEPLPFAGLASQKNHMAIYLMCLYGDPKQEKWFRDAWAKTGKKLDMGKSCIRFKKIEDVALDVLGEAIRRVPAEQYVASYEANLQGAAERRKAKKKAAPKRAKKAAAKKASGAKTKRAKAPAKRPAKKAGKAKKRTTRR